MARAARGVEAVGVVRRAAKVDANQAEIVAALKSSGCGVVSLASLGDGVLDLLVHEPFYPWRTVLMEVKDGEKPPSARRLTPAQQKFWAEWKGPKYLVNNIDEALAAVGIQRGS